MSDKKHEESVESSLPGNPEVAVAKDPKPSNSGDIKPVEVGGRDGPDPVRYGDWEKGGRCIDF